MRVGAPLADLRVIELGGIGPGPFCGMMLADHGAHVLRVVKPGTGPSRATDPLHRSRPSLSMDLRDEAELDVLRRLIQRADVLLEGFRPGVIERLGLAPEALLELNPRLVIGRMTGWGQQGPRSGDAGHDINYLATNGVLHALGRAGQRPTPPINLLADFGGGGMLLAFGVLAAVHESRRSGRGDVVDAAMVDGSALLSTMVWGYRARSEWSDQRGSNLLDTGAPFYDSYATADGLWLAIAPLEAAFWRQFHEALDLPSEFDRTRTPPREDWLALRSEIERRIATRTRADWLSVFAGRDACVSPVLSFGEALDDAHNRCRGTFVRVDGIDQPAPAPRYGRSETVAPHLSDEGDLITVLTAFGLTAADAEAIAELKPPSGHQEGDIRP